jgi:hypothetical protein
MSHYCVGKCFSRRAEGGQNTFTDAMQILKSTTPTNTLLIHNYHFKFFARS